MRIEVLFAVLGALMIGGCARESGAPAVSSTSPATQSPETARKAVLSNGPLWRSQGGGIYPASGSVARSIPCQLISLGLKLDPDAPELPPAKLIGRPSVCFNPSIYVGYLRSTLFIEGLDAKGARLFVTTVANPLHQDVEVPPPPSGGAMSHRVIETKTAAITAVISAPITPALVRLRWYEVGVDDQPSLLGETLWTRPQPAR